MARLPQHTPRPQTLEEMFGINQGPGQAPSSVMFNDYLASIPETNEQRREGAMLANMDARTNASMAADLEEANAIRAARNAGFTGSHPLREQADYATEQKLNLLLKPRQLEVDAAAKNLQARQAFEASEGAKDRAAALARTQMIQDATTGRTNFVQGQINNRADAKDNKRNMWGRAWDWLMGPDEQSAQAAPAASGGGVVMMMTPSGDVVPVPAAEVPEAEANGARRVQ